MNDKKHPSNKQEVNFFEKGYILILIIDLVILGLIIIGLFRYTSHSDAQQKSLSIQKISQILSSDNQSQITIPWLGLYVTDVTVEAAIKAGLDEVQGALVQKVISGSPAAKAGIQIDDIIRSFNGRRIIIAKELKSDLSGVDVGSEIEMCVARDGYRYTVYAVAEHAPEWSPHENKISPWLGVKVSEVTLEKDKERLEELDKDGGVLVEKVFPGSPAAKVGILPGDVLMSFNKRKVRTVREFLTDLSGAEVGEQVRICLIRGAIRKTVYPILEEIPQISPEPFRMLPTLEGGQVVSESYTPDLIYNVLPQASRFVRQLQPAPYYEGYKSNGKFVGVAFITTEICPEKTRGFQSRISTLVGVDVQGKIVGVKILQQAESLGRKTSELEGRFINQFVGKDVRDPLILGMDIDAITGATITSSAVNNSIREGLYIISKKVLHLSELNSKVVRSPTQTSVTLNRFLRLDLVFLLILAVLVFFGYRENSRLIRYLVFVISIIYLGIWKDGGISIIYIINMLNLNSPFTKDNLYLAILILLILGLTVFAGRIYCGWLCPFGAFLELLSCISPKYSIPTGLDSYLKAVKYVILLVLVLFAINLNMPDIAFRIANIIEPFETFWQIHGNLLAWVWLVLVIILSFFIPRFFCRYLCPLGAFFAVITMVASWLRLIKVKVKLPEKRECKGCKIALKACSINALSYSKKIEGPKIDDSECFKCEECRMFCPKCEVYATS